MCAAAPPRPGGLRPAGEPSPCPQPQPLSQPLAWAHFDLAPSPCPAPQSDDPRTIPAGRASFAAWSFERDAWQVVAREGPADRRVASPIKRPASAPPPVWRHAYPKSPPGKQRGKNWALKPDSPAADLPAAGGTARAGGPL